MTGARFKKEAERRMRKIGATDRSSVFDERVMGVKCTLRGIPYELSIMRSVHDGSSIQNIFASIAGLPKAVADRQTANQ